MRWRARSPPRRGDAASTIDPSGEIARSIELRRGRSGARAAPRAESVGPDPARSLAKRSTTRSVSLIAKSAEPSSVPPFAPRSAAGARSLAPPICGSPPSRRSSAISRPKLRRVGRLPPPAVGRKPSASERDGANAHASMRICRSVDHSRRVSERSSYGCAATRLTERGVRASLLEGVRRRAGSQSERSDHESGRTTVPS